MSKARRRTPLGVKIALAITSAFATLALLEGSLRVIAALRTGRAPQEVGPKLLPDGRRVVRVVCYGDSNTYGLYEQPEDAWPEQVQPLLQELAPPDVVVEVVNEGFAGQNSSDLRARCKEILARYDPDLLVVWVGKNNTWSTRNMEPYLEGSSSQAGPKILRDLYLYRLFRTLEGRHVSTPSIDLNDTERGGTVSAHDAFEIALQFDQGKRDVEISLALRALKGDLGEIAEQTLAEDVPLLVLGYPLDLDVLEKINYETADLASKNEWEWHDLRPWAASSLRRVTYPELFHHDYHLTALGYRSLAAELAPVLARSIGFATGEVAALGLRLNQVLGAPPARIEARRTSDDGFELNLFGRPGSHYLVLTGRSDALGTAVPPFYRLPLFDPVPRNSGQLDENGQGTVRLTQALPADSAVILAIQSTPFVVDGRQRFDPESFFVSDPVELR